jgi:hypothetical protein
MNLAKAPIWLNGLGGALCWTITECILCFFHCLFRTIWGKRGHRPSFFGKQNVSLLGHIKIPTFAVQNSVFGEGLLHRTSSIG